MKSFSIKIVGKVKGTNTESLTHVVDIEKKDGSKPLEITKQLGKVLNTLNALLPMSEAKYVIVADNGNKQIVTASKDLKNATLNVLLNLAHLVFDANSFDRVHMEKSPVLIDIAKMFGLKGLKEINAIQYQTAIKFKFGILTKNERIAKVQTLATITTEQDKHVLEAYKIAFPAKPKAIAAPKAEPVS